MQKLNLSEMIDKHFVAPKSNRGFKPSVFVNSLVLMNHEGGIRLGDLKYLKKDKALIKLLGLKGIPQPDSCGNWLRRNGKSEVGIKGVSAIIKRLCAIALNGIKEITLDIDASEISNMKKEGS